MPGAGKPSSSPRKSLQTASTSLSILTDTPTVRRPVQWRCGPRPSRSTTSVIPGQWGHRSSTTSSATQSSHRSRMVRTTPKRWCSYPRAIRSTTTGDRWPLRRRSPNWDCLKTRSYSAPSIRPTRSTRKRSKRGRRFWPPCPAACCGCSAAIRPRPANYSKPICGARQPHAALTPIASSLPRVARTRSMSGSTSTPTCFSIRGPTTRIPPRVTPSGPAARC